VIPERLDSGNYPLRTASLEGKSHQGTHLESKKLPSLLYRKGHLHGRHETRNGTVVQRHHPVALVQRYDATLSLETGLRMPGDYSQMQIPADGGRHQHSSPKAQARLIHCYASVEDHLAANASRTAGSEVGARSVLMDLQSTPA
jgi:hypothetical protein